MSTSTIADCPHCATAHAGFTYRADVRNPNKPQATVLFQCNVCSEVLAVPISNPLGSNNWIAGGSGDFDQFLATKNAKRIGRSYPWRQGIEVPPHLSDPVRRAFEQARKAEESRLPDAAAAMYRKAMDIATKELSPASAKLNLAARIDKLSSEHRITPDLKAWAHLIRLDGNLGAHGEEELSDAQVAQLGSFTDLFLRYTISMPVDIAQRKGATKAEVPHEA